MTKAKRLVALIRAMADKMERVARKMEAFSFAQWDGELHDHAIELAGAAQTARTWSDGIEALEAGSHITRANDDAPRRQD